VEYQLVSRGFEPGGWYRLSPILLIAVYREVGMRWLFRGTRGRHVPNSRKGREQGVTDALLAAILACLLAAAMSLSGAEAGEFREWLNSIRELLVVF
jgi:hypothetical protein